MQKEEMQENKQIIIWPVYLDAAKARTGRLAPLECSVKTPKVSEIFRAAEKLGLNPEIVKDKAHPAAWTDQSRHGRRGQQGPEDRDHPEDRHRDHQAAWRQTIIYSHSGIFFEPQACQITPVQMAIEVLSLKFATTVTFVFSGTVKFWRDMAFELHIMPPGIHVIGRFPAFGGDVEAAPARGRAVEKLAGQSSGVSLDVDARVVDPVDADVDGLRIVRIVVHHGQGEDNVSCR